MIAPVLMLAAGLAGAGAGQAARRVAPDARGLAAHAAVGLYLTAGLVALNIGARNWPGLVFGGSRALSLLFGGPGLFVASYGVAGVAAACAIARLRLTEGAARPGRGAWLGALQALAMVWCVAIAGLGLVGAALIERLSD